jgi:hypothetical protein
MIAGMLHLRLRRATPLLLTAVLAAASWAGCGGSGVSTTGSTSSGAGAGGNGSGAAGPGGGFTIGSSTGSGQAQIASLVFDPPALTLVLDGTTPQMGSFNLEVTYTGGSTEIVTPESVQFDRPDLASLQIGSPVVLTAPGEYAGTGTLHGIFGGLEATATLTVQVHLKDVDPSVPPAVVSKLDQAGLPADPAVSSLLYPYDATVFPQGLTSPLLMWNAASAADVVRVRYEEANYTFDGYYPVPLPAQVRVPQKYWDKIVASNPGGPLAVSVSRWDAASDTAYESAKQTWTIAPASLRGAIYYWTTSAGGQMARIQPGGAWESLYGGKCMGCHAVSSDGSTLVASVEGLPTNDGSGDNRPWVSFDLPNTTVRATSTFFSGNVAVNNDGKYTVFGSQKLRLGDTATGLEIPGSGLDALPLLPTSVGVMTPAFSPDGKHLAVVEGTGSWYHNLTGGRLATMDFDPVAQKFSNYQGLAPASAFPPGQQAIAYPTYSPDSQWIAFHVGDYATGCDVQGCDDSATQNGLIALQSVSGSGPVVLANLTDPNTPNPADKNHTLEPTFNPIERGGYFWVVVTSMRDYGNRITGTPNNGKKRLWVAAIDKNPAPGADPSHPAFFLEGQNEATTNMRGFWALSACIPTQGGGACQNGFECCSGFCDKGVCVTPQTFACVGAGGDCTATSDCCNDTVVSCLGGKCVPSQPK